MEAKGLKILIDFKSIKVFCSFKILHEARDYIPLKF